MPKCEQKSFWEVRDTFKPFTCGECGGEVKCTEGPGRKLELYRDVPELELYEKFPMPTCTKCGVRCVPAELEDELERELQSSFDRLVWKRMDLIEELLMNVLSHGRAVCDVCHKLPTRCRSNVSPGGPYPLVCHLCDECLPELETETLATTTELIRALAALRRGDG